MRNSGARFKTLLHEFELPAAQFAAYCKVSPQLVNNWFYRGVPQARVEDIAELFRVNPKWLRTGLGAKYACAGPDYNANSIAMPDLKVRPTWADFATSTADDALLPFYEDIEGRLSADAGKHLRLPLVVLQHLQVDAAQAIAVAMPDKSMGDILPMGSPLAIDQSLRVIHEGELYALLDNGRLIIKRVYHLPGNALRLRSHNHAEYPDQAVSADQLTIKRFEILGWVFWSAQINPRRPVN